MMAHGLTHAASIKLGLLLLAGLTGLCGCGTSQRLLVLQKHNTQEQALKLLDEGTRLEREGSPQMALERYNRAAMIYETPGAYLKMGHAFEALGKNEEAAKAYQQALRLTPDDQEARLGMLSLGYTPPGYTPNPQDLALASERAAKRPKPAIIPTPVKPPTATANATTSATASTATANATTSASATNAQEERAQVISEAAANRQPTPAEVRAALFGPDAERDRLPSATQPMYASDQDVILGSYPYHFQKAEQLRRRQQFDKAAEEYERALRADPKQIQARLDLGDMMLKLERQELARRHYDRAQHDFPESPRPLLKLGNYFLQVKQPDRARDLYRKALDKDPKYVEAYNNLAVLDMQEKNYTEAAKLLDEIIRLDPAYQNAYLNRGIIANDIEHNREAALRNYRKYVELGGPRAPQVRSWINDLAAPER